MKCETFELYIDEYMQESLSEELSGLISLHLNHCQDCREQLQQHRRYIKIMADFQPPEVGVQHLLNMVKNARDGEKPQARPMSAKRAFGLGFAAASFLAMAITLPFAYFQNQQAERSHFASSIAQEYSQNVSLVIESPRSVNAAQLTLQFPQPLRWKGLEQQQRVSWPVNLKPGNNILTIPMQVNGRLLNDQKPIIVAIIDHKELAKTFELPVELSPTKGLRTQAHLSL